ncbi:ATP-binding cassette domain-containing protein [bacterium]|nr:ATP-binding cassette domain-containing protein [bacterium]
MQAQIIKKENPDSKSSSLAKKILSLARPELKTLLIASLFLAIASICQLAYPQVIRNMVDQALQAKDLVKINEIVVIILVVFTLQAIASTIRYFLFTMAGERIVQRLRRNLYGAILKQEIAFFDFNKTGELISRISSDTTILQNAVSVNISMGLRNLAGAVGGLVLMAYTSPKLALSMLIVIPPVALGAAIFGKKIRVFSRKAQDSLAEASIVAEETISGIRTVRSFAQENFEKSRYDNSLTNSLKAVRDKVKQISWFMALASILGYAAISGVIWFGGRQVITGELSIGDLTQFLIYLMIVAFSVGSLGSLWGDFMSAVGAGKRIFEILDRKTQMELQEGDKYETLTGSVEFTNVSFAYPARRELNVLENFKLSLKSNQVVALVGPSGSGKTTVASLLTRLYDIDSGEISLDGKPIKTIEPNWLRTQIGLVSQEPILISSSIEDNIKYANSSASHEDVVRAAKLANAHDFIMTFTEQYNTMVGERGIQLSGGQKQRIAIARAILKNPKILILDEATSALDTESESLVQDALNKLMKNRTTLIIAHRLSTVQNADVICVLEKGKIVESGHHSELLKNEKGLYRKLVEGQLH